MLANRPQSSANAIKKLGFLVDAPWAAVDWLASFMLQAVSMNKTTIAIRMGVF
jgi:hypothetical protein